MPNKNSGQVKCGETRERTVLGEEHGGGAASSSFIPRLPPQPNNGGGPLTTSRSIIINLTFPPFFSPAFPLQPPPTPLKKRPVVMATLRLGTFHKVRTEWRTRVGGYKNLQYYYFFHPIHHRPPLASPFPPGISLGG